MKKYLVALFIIFSFFCVINCKALSCEWETEGDNTYCVTDTGNNITGLVKIDGYKYYFDDEGRLMHLKQKVGDKYYFFGRYSGKMQYGWLDSEGNRYYLDPTTGEMKFGWMRLDGDKYYFDEEGHLLHLKQLVDDTYYFFGRYSGKMQKGWLDSEGNRYYLNPTTGEMQFGWMKLDGDKYYFDEEGHLLHLKQLVDDKYYFFGRYSGKMQKGWLDSEGNRYYLNPTTGEMQFGWLELDGDKYYLDEEGHLLHLKQLVDDKYYFFGRYSGKMQKGWLDSEGNTYYLDPTTGEMQYGWLELDGDKYYLDDEGHVLHLKQKVDDEYYFFGRYSGKMQHGWLQSEGNVYYLDPDTGIMIMNGRYTIDDFDYDFTLEGKLVTGWQNYNGKQYYIEDGNYERVKGFKKIGNDVYYFDLETREKVTGKKVIDKNNYEFNDDGKLVKSQYNVSVYYSQRDSRWADKEYGNSTMAKTGCTPTSLAMAFTSILGKKILPTDVAKYLYEQTQEFNRKAKGSSGMAIIYATNHYHIKRTALTSKSQLQQALNDGKIVYGAMGDGDFAAKQWNHAILMAGKKGNTTYVHDPLNESKNNWYSIDSIWEQQSKDPDDYSGGSNFYALERDFS